MPNIRQKFSAENVAENVFVVTLLMLYTLTDLRLRLSLGITKPGKWNILPGTPPSITYDNYPLFGHTKPGKSHPLSFEKRKKKGALGKQYCHQ